MKVRDLIKDGMFGCIGYVNDIQTVNNILSVFQANLPLIEQFNHIYFVFNVDNRGHYDMVRDAIVAILPRAVVIASGHNKGHSFGTAELDTAVFSYAKRKGVKWLFKSATDVILFPEFTSQTIGESDFYYLNGIGYGGMKKYGYDIDRVVEEDFYPQTNFYIINVEKVDYINDSSYIKETYEICTNTPGYNGKPWEYISGWSCEDFLKQSVERNNLTKEQLITPEIYKKLVTYIKHYEVHDPSHKNIKVGNICHYQYPNQKVVVI